MHLRSCLQPVRLDDFSPGQAGAAGAALGKWTKTSNAQPEGLEALTPGQAGLAGAALPGTWLFNRCSVNDARTAFWVRGPKISIEAARSRSRLLFQSAPRLQAGRILS